MQGIINQWIKWIAAAYASSEMGFRILQTQVRPPVCNCHEGKQPVRTARGDLTEEELIALVHHQLNRYDIDVDPNLDLSKRVAKTILWRFGRN